METAQKILEKISAGDIYARHNGIEIVEIRPGYAKTRMVVGENHLNAVNITHGAAVFGLVDLAFAAASNSHGQVAVALNMNISYVKATTVGNILTATATEDKLTNRTGLYRIVVEDEKGDLVAVAEGLVFRKNDTI
ncbi:MAG: PaaI family thioesterase [Bacillota bacterium]